MSVKNISWWINETYLQKFDFAILGNGFTGIQAAIQLRKKHPLASIAIIDKNYICSGASLRNAGFACFGSVSEILDDLENQSKDEVFNLVKMRYEGLRYLIDDFGENIDYHQGNAQEVFLENEKSNSEKCVSMLGSINNEMKNITNLSNTYFEKKQNLSSGFLTNSIGNNLEGYLNTGKMYHKMHKKAIEMDIFWISNFEVLAVEKNQDYFQIIAKNNEVINANIVISCLNAYTKTLIKNAPIVPSRGQIIVSHPLKKQVLSGILHADKGYIYARPLGDRILIGGARNTDFEQEQTYSVGENKKITAQLLAFVNKYFLQNTTTEIAMNWSCIMAMSPEKGGLPIVEEIEKNLWVCYRLGGMGVALSAMLARNLVNKISG